MCVARYVVAQCIDTCEGMDHCGVDGEAKDMDLFCNYIFIISMSFAFIINDQSLHDSVNYIKRK